MRVTEGNKFPGLRLTKMFNSKMMVFRLKNQEIANHAAAIMQRWASAKAPYTKESYLATYPSEDWENRSEQDLIKFGLDGKKVILGPATPFLAKRAEDILARFEHGLEFDLIKLKDEGIRRAIKFSSRRNLDNVGISKGQRCTPSLIAAFQAAILSPIVIARENKVPFKVYKGKKLQEYVNDVLVKNWQETKLGNDIIDNNYHSLFPTAFRVDQRYATPLDLFEAIKKDAENIVCVGYCSYFNERLEITDANNKTHIFKTDRSHHSPVQFI